MVNCNALFAAEINLAAKRALFLTQVGNLIASGGDLCRMSHRLRRAGAVGENLISHPA
jgi:hypothetical protein